MLLVLTVYGHMMVYILVNSWLHILWLHTHFARTVPSTPQYETVYSTPQLVARTVQNTPHLVARIVYTLAHHVSSTIHTTPQHVAMTVHNTPQHVAKTVLCT